MHIYKAEMLRALEHKKPETCVPIWELEFHLWGRFSGKPFYAGEDFAKLTAAEKERAIGGNTEVFAEVCEKLHFAALTIPGGYWEIAPGVPAYYWLPDKYRFMQARALHDALGDRLLLIANTGGVLCMPDADNYEAFSYLLFDEPDKVEQMARDCIAGGIRNMERFADIGIEAVLTASDIADNRGPFFSPSQMERFVSPFIRQFASEAKARKLHSILHTDGNINALMEGLSASGLSALQGIDPVAGMDMGVLQQKHKQTLTLCGNLDCGLLLTGTQQAVYDGTVALLDACRTRGGFVLGASNAVQYEVPKENYEVMVAAWLAAKHHTQTIFHENHGA